jgi:hypothetical protein
MSPYYNNPAPLLEQYKQKKLPKTKQTTPQTTTQTKPQVSTTVDMKVDTPPIDQHSKTTTPKATPKTTPKNKQKPQGTVSTNTFQFPPFSPLHSLGFPFTLPKPVTTISFTTPQLPKTSAPKTTTTTSTKPY